MGALHSFYLNIHAARQAPWGSMLACAARLLLAATMAQTALAQTAQTGQAKAGTIIFSQGDAAIVRAGASIKALKGQAIESGDSLRTGQGQAQIRFSDGGLVALGAQSEFQIDRYMDALNAQQDSFLTSLIKGSMRGITGLIGKRDRRNYKVRTATATLGIRGSAYELRYQPDGSVLARCEQDGIELCTTAACVELAAGESAWAFDPKQPPVRVNAQADLPPAEMGRDPSLPNERVDANGQSWPALQSPNAVGGGGYPYEGGNPYEGGGYPYPGGNPYEGGGLLPPGGGGIEVQPNPPNTNNPNSVPSSGG